ncbi:phage late control D family protein [Gynuella sp.]|uniref:phage late control D family protein n=1 Tax=Gynuella sp. TaxID=2969146 RepID=UPI003D097C1E
MGLISAQLLGANIPGFSLKVNGTWARKEFMDRMVAIQLVQHSGLVSDQLSLTLDDRPTWRGSGIFLPDLQQETVITLHLGYEPSLVNMGEYLVSHISLNESSNGRTMTISANSSLLNRDVSCTWNDLSLSSLVEQIARQHGLTAKVSPLIGQEIIDSINQQKESNGAFLTRLAELYDGVFKVMGRNLLFMKKGEGTSASGIPMKPVSIARHDIVQWTKKINRQQNYTYVCATWRDLIDACEREEMCPSGTLAKGDTLMRLPHVFASKEEAEAAAKAKFHELNRQDQTLSLSVLGNANITAAGRISLSSLRTGVDGEYTVKTVTHSLSSSGFLTNLEACQEPYPANG